MARILLPDFSDRRLVASSRSLARTGDVCHQAWCYAGAKLRRRRWLKGRGVAAVHAVASVDAAPDAYVGDVLELCSRERIDVLLPFGQRTTEVLCENGARVARAARILLPPPEAFAVANDKLRIARHAEALGVDSPRSFEVEAEEDLPRIGGDVRYPAVVKARTGSGVATGLRFARNEEELRRGYAELVEAGERTPAERGTPMVQEFVPGYIHDACAMAVRGDVVQVLTQVRKLMYPVSGGVGAIVFTTRDPALERSARRLLESLEWNGPAQIEFKLDPRDGRFKLIEVNPRFWGTLELSIAAGIDFPRMVRDHLLGETVPRDRPYAAGIRYRFLFTRGLLAYRQLLGAVGWSGLRDPQRYARTVGDWDLRDPLPDLVRVLNTLRSLAGGRDRRIEAAFPLEWLNRLDRVLPEVWPDSPDGRRRALES